MLIFHKDVFVPAALANYVASFNIYLKYSKHCLEREYIRFKPSNISLKNFVEIEAEKPLRILKVVVREHYDEYDDLVLVIIPDLNYKIGFVKTVWLNEKTDTHKTLNRSRYVQKS